MQNSTNWLRIVLMVTVCAGGLEHTASFANAESPADAQAIDEIRQSAADFSDAFNAHDAKRVADHFTEEGDFITDSETLVGRAAIQKQHETFFTNNPKATIHMAIDSIRILGETAIEDGRAVVGPMPEQAEAFSKYTAIHVKKDGRWQLASVRETRITSPADGRHLRDFNWFVGTWSAKNGDMQLDVKCRWMNGERYLIRTFQLHVGDELSQSGMQVIGWDPLSEHVVSWLFDSNGGHAVGLWSPSESGWTIGASGITSDGTPTSATNSLRKVDEDRVAFKSVNRRLGDASVPDIDEVILTRKKDK